MRNPKEFCIESRLVGSRAWRPVSSFCVFNDREVADAVCASRNECNRGWSEFRVVKFVNDGEA